MHRDLKGSNTNANQKINLTLYDAVWFDIYKIFVRNFCFDGGWEPNNFAKHKKISTEFTAQCAVTPGNFTD